MRRGGDGWCSSQRSLRPVEHDEVMTGRLVYLRIVEQPNQLTP
ncbi:hypothetical protein HMPREF9622_00704 [Cutibacterium modestum HL037PA3]|nr:hypothetical protein HMPREF9621_01280 [Cutibacterium modestum HL037PA2]EFT16250.1 hypothetical protein HMPREF9622_00704 [Cutibacterium modestum HL037PA3]